MPSASKFIPVFALVLFSFTRPLFAQDSPWSLGASASLVNFDLAGTGHAPGVAVHATRDLTDNLAVNFRGTFAKIDQQIGRTTLIAPEAQVQYRWNIARVSPFVGGGAGLLGRDSAFRTDWDPTLSFGGGAAVRLTDNLDVVGELRIRGVEWRFTGTIDEWSAGIAWRP
jgi:hypothetical protein